MKTNNLQYFFLWVSFFVIVGIAVGRCFERMAALRDEVNDLKHHIRQLEAQNIHREERRRLVSKLVAWIPLVKHFFH